MSKSPRYLVHLLESDDPLAFQAAELASLRARVAAAQARTGTADPALIAEFAEAQRLFLEAKIQMERERVNQMLYAAPVEPLESGEPQYLPEVPVLESSMADLAVAAPTRRRVLAASNSFWVTVIVLLTFLACFLHSPYSYPE